MVPSNPDPLRQWVAQEIASLDPPPDYRPDPDRALALMHDRIRTHLWRPAWPRRLAFAAALLAAVFLLFSSGRLAAQLWQMLTVRRVAVIRVNPWPDGVPSPQVNVLGTVIPPLPARDAQDAAWRVRYQPRLPHAGVLNGSPRLSTTFSVAAGAVIHTADLELALEKTGISGVTVPPAWDGAQLALHSSALVIAEWPDFTLVQSLPLTLTAPPGFDFPAFSTLILRILGVPPDEARRLAVRTGIAPPWLAPLDSSHLRGGETIQEVQLNSGPATLLEANQHRAVLLWMVSDRIYLIDTYLGRDLALAAANAIQ